MNIRILGLTNHVKKNHNFANSPGFVSFRGWKLGVYFAGKRTIPSIPNRKILPEAIKIGNRLFHVECTKATMVTPSKFHEIFKT